ncbi:MAG: hypothetical protein IJ833_10380 [Lachnospiraceae bacterium]|nr:hypothetical protein [Lachnospiraceae bacterium]
MARKSYMFTNKKHSQKAIMSTILGMISILSLAIVIFLSYRSGGVALTGYGVTGFLATIFSIVGLGLGIAAIRDKIYYRFFPWLGFLLNLLVLGCISFLLYFGSGM